jgi:phosphohistidine swiveling domain-containing protein
MELEFEAPGPGPWQQDSAHVPQGWSPLVAELYPPEGMKGFAEGFARWGTLLDALAWTTIHGFPYQQPQPFDLPGPDGPPSPEFIHAEIERRTGVAAAAFANKIWRDDIVQWDNELKPAAIARHRELGDVELSDLDGPALNAHIEACIEHMQAMIYQHHRFTVSSLVPVADFILHAAGWLGEPPPALFGVLDGYSPVSGVLSPETEAPLEALRADASARELLTSAADPSARLAELRERVPEVDEYVRSAGFRLVEGFDVTSPTAIERPETILGRLAAGLETDPDLAKNRADETASAMRSRVPDEHREMFDELLHEARVIYRLRDERGLYSDVSAFGLFRLALLEAARRMVAAGSLHEVDHIFETSVADLRALLSGASPPSADDLAERAAHRRAIVDHGAPRHLGPPPPPPPPVDQLPPPLARVMSAAGFAIEGVLGQLDEPAGDSATVIGIGANVGIYEGRVHLVASLDDLFSLEPGDVLVTPATGEAFNSMIHLVGAIVTDHGSYASHAGIVARECGIPAVVGCVDATKRLAHGQNVRVDGTNGQVLILP